MQNNDYQNNPSPSEATDDYKPTPIDQKKSSSAEDDLSPIDKKILKAEETVRKLKEASKRLKKEQKEKHEQDILKLLRSEGLLKNNLDTWSTHINDIKELLMS